MVLSFIIIKDDIRDLRVCACICINGGIMKFYRKKSWIPNLMIGVSSDGTAFFYFEGKKLAPYSCGPYDAFTSWEEISM